MWACFPITVKVRERRRERNLDSVFNLFSFGAFFKIGNHTEAPTAVFNESDGGSPSPKSFDGRIFGLKVEILEQTAFHNGRFRFTVCQRGQREKRRPKPRKFWTSVLVYIQSGWGLGKGETWLLEEIFLGQWSTVLPFVQRVFFL